MSAGCSVLLTLLVCLLHLGQMDSQHFTNEWVVRVQGGPQVAQLLALQMGYTYIGPVAGFADTYRMLKDDHPQVSKRGETSLTEGLTADKRVVWAEQQFAKKRDKRGVLPATPDVTTRVRRSDLAVPDRDARFFFNDKLWYQQWYLHDTRTRYDLPKLDLQVLPVYTRGITGKGVRVCILDDGLEYTHEDLRQNYDPEISYDANDDDSDPMPRYDSQRTNQHGTRCAGEVAMAANNGKCGVGVAFNSRIGGVRLLDGMVNDRVEGVALRHANDKVDIYSASWGPSDNGQTVEGPGRLALESLEQGINKGRDGKGVIFVWASGNGGSKGDDCNCDGYITNIYTLAIGSASQQGHFPWYGEQCASTLAAAYSSGAYTDQMIVTTDLYNKCTNKHTGTSAAAPLAAGIIALGLEVNPALTWRDVQHLIVWTSEWAPLQDNKGWQTNAAGFWVNTRFGFGLLNADGFVTAAANWTNVPAKGICSVSAESRKEPILRQGEVFAVDFQSSACEGTESEIHYLEHVEVLSNIQYPVRGALEVALTSPQGTRVPLLRNRMRDNSTEGFFNWKFMSVLTWGENPQGKWIVEILAKEGPPGGVGYVDNFTLILHGTKERPAHMAEGPRLYNEDYNRIHRMMGAGRYNDKDFVSPQATHLDWNEVDPLEWSELNDLGIVNTHIVRRQPPKSDLLERLFGERSWRT